MLIKILFQALELPSWFIPKSSPHFLIVISSQIIDSLVESGHEVIALDWIGHGGSDKPLSPSLISFDLHMRTLACCIQHFDLAGCHILAHDWGG